MLSASAGKARDRPFYPLGPPRHTKQGKGRESALGTHRVNSRQRSTLVAFRSEADIDEPRLQRADL